MKLSDIKDANINDIVNELKRRKKKANIKLVQFPLVSY